MSWLAIAWAEKAPVADVYERCILTLMAHRAKSDGTGAHPSIPTMAEYAMCEDTSIKRRIRALQERRVIAPGDQTIAAYIDARYRPRVWDLLIPFSWYGPTVKLEVNQERLERGLPPLDDVARPPLLPPPPRKVRADSGVPRQRVTTHDQGVTTR